MRLLFAAVVSEPKKFRLYDAEARRDRIAFLSDQLKFKPPAPNVIAKIPDLPQPPEPRQ